MTQDETARGRDGVLDFERLGKDAAITERIFSLVGKSAFFAEFSREDIAYLAGCIEVYRAPPGAAIIRESESGDFMLLLIEGAVDIFKKDSRGEQRLMTRVGPGATLGEMSMIDGEPRFATCIVSETAIFAVLTRHNMAEIILDHPAFGSKLLIKLITLLSLRLRQTSARLLQCLER